MNVEEHWFNKVLSAVWKGVRTVLYDWINGKLSGSGDEKTSMKFQGLTLAQELDARERALRIVEQHLSGKGWEKAAGFVVSNVMIRAEPVPGGGARDRLAFLRREVSRQHQVTRGARAVNQNNTLNVRDHRSN